jgi:LacI family transcriptional regulator
VITRRTHLIGLIIPDLMHSFFAEVAKGVSRKLRSGGYNVVIANTDEDAELESLEIDGLLARRVDGKSLPFRRIDDEHKWDCFRAAAPQFRRNRRCRNWPSGN